MRPDPTEPPSSRVSLHEVLVDRGTHGAPEQPNNRSFLFFSLGENLAYFQPAVPKCEGAMVDNCVNCREMVQRWYDEVKNYDFDKGGPKAASGAYKHFSQLIWANTAELGVGTAVSKRYGFITVARYRPTGNDGGIEEFIRNVPPEGGNMYLNCKNI